MKLTNHIHYILLTGYGLVILFLSIAAINGASALNKSKVVGFRADYMAHVLLFLPWMFLACWGWGCKINRRIFLAASITGIALAAISEGVQLFLPYRAFNIIDFIANSLGVAMGAVSIGIGWKREKKVIDR